MISEKITNKYGNTIEGPLLLKPRIFRDSRGYFFESWNQQNFNEIVGKHVEFVQDNHSFSIRGALRGLHYQKKPYHQGKLVRCISGEIFDILVDLRKSSITFSQWFGVKLTSENNYQLWIPEGFAHGFLSISENAEILYKTTSFWNAESEITLLWDDPIINIDWPFEEYKISNPFLSDKDMRGKYLSDLEENEIF